MSHSSFPKFTHTDIFYTPGAIAIRSRASGNHESEYDLDDKRLAVAKTFGATTSINSTDGHAAHRVMELTGGAGVDVAIEAVVASTIAASTVYALQLALCYAALRTVRLP